MTLADGRKLHVPHNEFLSVSPNGRTAVLFTDREDHFTIIDMLMMTSADVEPARRRKS